MIKGEFRKIKKDESRKVTHDKNAVSRKRKLSLLLQNILLWGKISTVLFIIIIFSLYRNKIIGNIKNYFYSFTYSIGCQLNSIIIENRRYSDVGNVIQKLRSYNQKSILSIDLENIREEILKNHFIKDVIVVRKLPDTIHLKLFEKKPIAVWQQNQELSLIDEEGDVIAVTDVEALMQNFGTILHVVGHGANVYAPQLLTLLENYPAISNVVISATRFGDRRWDLNLRGNVKVKLPETDIDHAIDYLTTLYNNGSLFSSNIKAIDMRNGKRYYIEYQDVPKHAGTKKQYQ